jgi:hypothetical protein
LNITTSVTIPAQHTCAACIADEDARPGQPCNCYETEFRVTVNAEVSPDGTVEILAIHDEDGEAWSPRDLEDMWPPHARTIREACWERFDKLAPVSLPFVVSEVA